MQHKQVPWWQWGVIYQIYPRSFKDGNGDGTGDLQGILAQLEYLIWLGVDAIWISPIYPSPLADFGYDISNYTSVDPIFGDLATFDKLIQKAHQSGLHVIIDFVPNHTSDEHPWFLESSSSRENPKRNWYMWADPRPDGSPPNNWLSMIGGSAWEWSASTGQYYLHSFFKKQPDLNWRTPAVKEAMFDIMRFWLEREVDGFRIDAAHFILKDPYLRDNPPNSAKQQILHKPMGDYDSQLHLYDKGYPDVHDVLREIRQLLESYSTKRPRAALGEIHIYDLQVWVSYYGANLDELHMPCNFGLIGVEWKAQTIRQVVDKLEAVLPLGAWPNYVLGNHDESRIVSRIGMAQARVGMLLLLTLRGTPTLYYGDEIGMHDVNIPAERVRDPIGTITPDIRHTRDPERTPLQWDDEPNAGFCPPGVEPWLPLAGDYGHINIAVQRKDPHSMLALTRALLEIRRTTPALSEGSYHPVENVPEDCFVYLRHFANQRRLIVLNFSDREQTLRIPEFGAAQIVISTYLDRQEPIDLISLRLRRYEGCIIALADVMK